MLSRETPGPARSTKPGAGDERPTGDFARPTDAIEIPRGQARRGLATKAAKEEKPAKLDVLAGRRAGQSVQLTADSVIGLLVTLLMSKLLPMV